MSITKTGGTLFGRRLSLISKADGRSFERHIQMKELSHVLIIFSESGSAMERKNAWLLLGLVNILILTIQKHQCKLFLVLK